MQLSRFEKIRKVLDARQPDLTLLLEDVNKPHNLAAIARTCDAVGIGEIHAVSPMRELRISQQAASGVRKWIKLNKYKKSEDAYKNLKAQGYSMVVTHLSDKTIDYRDVDFTRPVCVVAGSEQEGVTDYAIEHADCTISIPMVGMVQSLNVSVAMSIILFEAFQQRQKAGLYNQQRISNTLYQKLLFEAAHPKVSRYCQRHRLHYPRLDDAGNIIDAIDSLEPLQVMK